MGEMVRFSGDGGACDGYLAIRPTSSAPGTPVIVLHEWWGLVSHIKSVTDRIADDGFVALAPDLYHGVATSEPDTARELAGTLAIDRAASDIAGAAAYLAARDDCTDRVGVVGFCLGGSLAIWSATLSGHIGAAAGFYPSRSWERLSPKWANYQGRRAVIHCAEGDGGSGAPRIQQARAAIEEAGGHCALYDYPDTRHAFFNDDRSETYDSEASALAWARTLELFRDHL